MARSGRKLALPSPNYMTSSSLPYMAIFMNENGAHAHLLTSANSLCVHFNGPRDALSNDTKIEVIRPFLHIFANFLRCQSGRRSFADTDLKS